MKRLLILLLFSSNFVSATYVQRDSVVIGRLLDWVIFVSAGSTKEEKQVWDIVRRCLHICIKNHTPETSKKASDYLDTLNNEYSTKARKFLEHHKII